MPWGMQTSNNLAKISQPTSFAPNNDITALSVDKILQLAQFGVTQASPH